MVLIGETRLESLTRSVKAHSSGSGFESDSSAGIGDTEPVECGEDEEGKVSGREVGERRRQLDAQQLRLDV